MIGKLIDFKENTDGRGMLVSCESFKNIPFEIKRVYYLVNLDSNHPRGFHAHKNLKQVAICVHGKCRFILDDGKNREEYWLDSPIKGLVIENFIWREMDSFSQDCVILVLASEYYSELDYIRNYEHFQKEVLK